ncbi:MAG: hypothetical protein ABQ298_03785 [Puniceicoccaceae bacterium]
MAKNNTTQRPTRTLTDIEIAVGAADVAVAYRKGYTPGDADPKSVIVSEVSARQIPTLAERAVDEPALVEYYAGQTEGWADHITHQTYLEILSIGDQLNQNFIAGYLERTAEKNERLLATAERNLAAMSRMRELNLQVADDIEQQKPSDAPAPESPSSAQASAQAKS